MATYHCPICGNNREETQVKKQGYDNIYEVRSKNIHTKGDVEKICQACELRKFRGF